MGRLHVPYSGCRHGNPDTLAPALEIKNLSAGYSGEQRLALKKINLSVPVGARVAIVGPNGSGKSTLLKSVAGLLPIRNGKIKIYGEAVGACFHRTVYLPQRSEVQWSFPIDVRKLVLSGRYVHLGWFHRAAKEDYQKVDVALNQLGIKSIGQRQISQLSGGQQQRVLLARALVQDADLLLLDEPLNAIDADTREIVSKVLKDLKDKGKTVIVATHFLDKMAQDYDGAFYLNEGEEAAIPPGGFSGIKLR
ncbi:MAG: ABC transporter ATP-binding protein [Candidatus Omnitrophica bacterium]|nr:ABC transporter ATP-binding protein [Candidatus Omnitrophota bacterium]MCB9747498.1 ABC transporter ATP-binding protein [Candidatus Omnitrophota bacterium]